MALAALCLWLTWGAWPSWSFPSGPEIAGSLRPGTGSVPRLRDLELANTTGHAGARFVPLRALHVDRDQRRDQPGSPSMPWWFWAPPPMLGILRLPCMRLAVRLSCVFGIGLAISSLCAIVCTLFGQVQLPSVLAKFSSIFMGCLMGVVLAHGDFVLVGILQTPILGDSIEYVCLAIAVSPVSPEVHRLFAERNGPGLTQVRLKLICMSFMGGATLLMINTLKVGRDWTLTAWEVPTW
mmetsp:Transcript_105102/g.313982  ORF Transcript_105102/g.313982 Transcript_105102/m.313982 type:complete len:238 (-) Transcript_105102:13-726(-)